MNKFPPVAMPVGMVDCIVRENAVGPDDDNGDDDEENVQENVAGPNDEDEEGDDDSR